MSNQQSHVVLGLGATGLSVVRFLCEQGITPVVMDSRAKPPGADQLAQLYPDVSLITDGFDCRYLVQATQIIISPGIAVDTPEVLAAIDMGIEVVGDVELFARAIKDQDCEVVAITGSNGKTTVTTLVGEMAAAAGLSYAVGGNIGVPVLDLLQDPKQLYVLELSSFQLETTDSLNCVAATCLNISEDHMDRYCDLQAYRQAKLKLYDQTKCVIFNRDDELTRPHAAYAQQSFGYDLPANASDWGMSNRYIMQGAAEVMPISEIALVGSHNHANLLAAMSLADKAGIAMEHLVQVASQFTGLPHRFEVVGLHEGVTFVNDSKATNVGATIAAINSLSDHNGALILIAGGDGKGADFKPLANVLSEVTHLITLGKDGDKIAALKSGTLQVKSMTDAVTCAAKMAKSHDIVLLSPACASLDMYPNFMARGDDFRQLVAQLNG